MPALGAAYVVIRASLAPLKAGLALAKTMVTKAMATIANIVRKMTETAWKWTKRLAFAITGAITGSVWAFGRFEKAMRKATAVSDVTGGQFIKMSKMAREQAIKLNVSAKDLASGFYYLGSAGLNATEQLDAFVPVAKMAKALTVDMGLATERVVDIMKAFKIGFEDTTKVTDILTKTVTSSNQVFTELGDAMRYVAPVARAFHNTLEDTNALLMIMADVGIKGAKGGVVLRRSLTNLAAPTSQLRAKLDELGIAVYDSMTGKMKPFVQLVGEIGDALKDAGEAQKFMTFEVMFGKRAIAGQLEIFDKGSAALRELADSLREAGGATEKVVKVQLNALLEQFGRLHKIVTDSAIVFGSALAPALRIFTDQLQKSAMQFNKWVRSHKYDIMEWAGIILTRVNLVRRTLFDFGKWLVTDWPDIWRFVKDSATKNWDTLWKGIKETARVGWENMKDMAIGFGKSLWLIMKKVTIDIFANIGLWAKIGAAKKILRGALIKEYLEEAGYRPGFEKIPPSARKEARKYAQEQVRELEKAKYFEGGIYKPFTTKTWKDVGEDIADISKPIFERMKERMLELQKFIKELEGADIPKPAGLEKFEDNVKKNIELMHEEMKEFEEMIEEMKEAEKASDAAIRKATEAAGKGRGAEAGILGAALTGRTVGIKEAWAQTMQNIHQRNLLTSMDKHLANIENNTDDIGILGTVGA